MSYCVHCGVELDKTAKKCPLCQTPVLDPKSLPDPEAIFPYPQEKGQVDLPRKDIGVLVSSLVLATSLTCLLLNVLIYNAYPWSMAVVGASVLLWVLLLPLFFFKKIPVYVCLFLDGAAVALYLQLIAGMTDTKGWVLHLGLPIVLVVLIVAEVLALCINLYKFHFLTGTIEVMSSVGVICVAVECIVDYYLTGKIAISWAAVVGTVSIVVDVAAIVILCNKKLRGQLRKRLHL